MDPNNAQWRAWVTQFFQQAPNDPQNEEDISMHDVVAPDCNDICIFSDFAPTATIGIPLASTKPASCAPPTDDMSVDASTSDTRKKRTYETMSDVEPATDNMSVDAPTYENLPRKKQKVDHDAAATILVGKEFVVNYQISPHKASHCTVVLNSMFPHSSNYPLYFATLKKGSERIECIAKVESKTNALRSKIKVGKEAEKLKLLFKQHAETYYKTPSLFQYPESLVKYFGIAETEHINVIVMEKMAGSLHQVLHSTDDAMIQIRATLSLERRFELMKQCVRCATMLHSMHLAHMDIKPQNILVSSDLKRVCFADFGSLHIASNWDGSTLDEKLMQKNGATYSIGYAAPEVLDKKNRGKKLSHQDAVKQDVYCIGVTCAQIWTNRKKDDLIIEDAFPEDIADSFASTLRQEMKRIMSIKSKERYVSHDILQSLLNLEFCRKSAYASVLQAFYIRSPLELSNVNACNDLNTARMILHWNPCMFIYMRNVMDLVSSAQNFRKEAALIIENSTCEAALFFLGEAYEYGKRGFEKNFTKMLHCYVKGRVLEYEPCKTKLAKLQKTNPQVDVELRKMLNHAIHKAILEKCPYSMTLVGCFHYYKIADAAKKIPLALSWYYKAAEVSYPPAQYGLSLAYKNAVNVPKDKHAAKSFADAAARQGFASAIQETAEYDPKNCRKKYFTASIQLHATALLNMGNAFLDLKKSSSAKIMFELAFAQGCPDAALQLACIVARQSIYTSMQILFSSTLPETKSKTFNKTIASLRTELSHHDLQWQSFWWHMYPLQWSRNNTIYDNYQGEIADAKQEWDDEPADCMAAVREFVNDIPEKNLVSIENLEDAKDILEDTLNANCLTKSYLTIVNDAIYSMSTCADKFYNLRPIIGVLDSMCKDHEVEEDLIVYRAAPLVGNNSKLFEKGSNIQFAAFLNASPNVEQVTRHSAFHSAVLEITIPRGFARLFYIEDMEEYLFAPFCKFFVNGVKDAITANDKPFNIITMELLK